MAAIIGSAGSVGNIAFQFMLSEDVDEEKRVTGFNMVNVILLGSGIFTFIAGYFVNKYGVVAAERGFFIFAIISYIFMAIVRNQFFEETKTGIKVKNEAKKKGYRMQSCLRKDVVHYILHHSGTRVGVSVFLYFNIFTVFGALSSSMYYVPYLTNNLGFNAVTSSLFGTILSVGMLFVSTLVVPILFKFGILKNIVAGAGILIISMLFIILAPYQNIGWMVLCNVLYSFGYGIIKPNVDTLLANVIEGKLRASVYSMVTLLSTILGTVVGFVSGFIFAYFPIFLFGVAIVFLLLMIITILLSYKSCNTRDEKINNLGNC